MPAVARGLGGGGGGLGGGGAAAEERAGAAAVEDGEGLLQLRLASVEIGLE